jgi:hypothetical protein
MFDTKTDAAYIPMTAKRRPLMKKQIKRHKHTFTLAGYLHDALMIHCAKLDKRQSAVVTEALRKYLKVGEEK